MSRPTEWCYAENRLSTPENPCGCDTEDRRED